MIEADNHASAVMQFEHYFCFDADQMMKGVNPYPLKKTLRKEQL